MNSALDKGLGTIPVVEICARETEQCELKTASALPTG